MFANQQLQQQQQAMRNTSNDGVLLPLQSGMEQMSLQDQQPQLLQGAEHSDPTNNNTNALPQDFFMEGGPPPPPYGQPQDASFMMYASAPPPPYPTGQMVDFLTPPVVTPQDPSPSAPSSTLLLDIPADTYAPTTENVERYSHLDALAPPPREVH